MAAAELAGSYGSDLNVVGTYAASAPTDLRGVLLPTDGNSLAGLTGYVLRGLTAPYPQLDQPLRSTLTPRGPKCSTTPAANA